MRIFRWMRGMETGIRCRRRFEVFGGGGGGGGGLRWRRRFEFCGVVVVGKDGMLGRDVVDLNDFVGLLDADVWTLEAVVLARCEICPERSQPE